MLIFTAQTWLYLHICSLHSQIEQAPGYVSFDSRSIQIINSCIIKSLKSSETKWLSPINFVIQQDPLAYIKRRCHLAYAGISANIQMNFYASDFLNPQQIMSSTHSIEHGDSSIHIECMFQCMQYDALVKIKLVLIQ